MATRVKLTGTLTCTTPEDVAIVQDHLPEHIRLSRAEAGCVSFVVSQTTNPLIWQVDETFTDQAAFDAHQVRTRASLWFDATRHLARQFHIT